MGTGGIGASFGTGIPKQGTGFANASESSTSADSAVGIHLTISGRTGEHIWHTCGENIAQ